jgi:hypothetical protein
MVNRCTNPRNASWPRYGGRGITVCAEWLKFENFLRDMGENPPGLSIDRKDNGKGYSPENCRWATPAQQVANRRPDSRRVDSVTGITGVSWKTDRKVFRAEIKANGVRRYLGATPDFFEACCLRKSAELIYRTL